MEPNVSLNVLMDELNHLLDERIQDQEIRQLFEEYQHREGASEESLDLFEKEYGVRVCLAIFVPFTKGKTAVATGCMCCTRVMPRRADVHPFI